VLIEAGNALNSGDSVCCCGRSDRFSSENSLVFCPPKTKGILGLKRKRLNMGIAATIISAPLTLFLHTFSPAPLPKMAGKVGTAVRGQTARCRKSGIENIYGPIMVQQLFPSALNTLQRAIRVAWFQLVTCKWGAVTAEAAGSSPVVPAILSKGVIGRDTENCYPQPHPQFLLNSRFESRGIKKFFLCRDHLVEAHLAPCGTQDEYIPRLLPKLGLECNRPASTTDSLKRFVLLLRERTIRPPPPSAHKGAPATRPG